MGSELDHGFFQERESLIIGLNTFLSHQQKEMKKRLDWESREVTNIFDEVTLWSAPFGRLLLEQMPMNPQATIVDIGFGTGFPLIELSQRFGKRSKIYGIDIWQEGIHRTKEKIKTLELDNIEILQESATSINIGDQEVDLITSNLGVNNFDQKHEVYQEIYRILKQGGRLCLTTNPIGTFEELFGIFDAILKEMDLEEEQNKLQAYVEHRNTEPGIVSEFNQHGLTLVKSMSDSTNIRFVDAEALLNHSLIRIGFRESWENMIHSDQNRSDFFDRLLQNIQQIIDTKGEFVMTIPMLYLEFEKS